MQSSSIVGDQINKIIHPATTLGSKQSNLLVDHKGCPCRGKGLEKLKVTANLQYVARPIKDVNISAHGEGIGHDEFTQDAMQIWMHTIAYLAFKDTRYATKALSIQDAWNTQCMTFKGSNAPLEVAWGATCMVRSMEILKYVAPKEWTPAYAQRFDAFLDRIVLPNLLARYNEIKKWNNNWILTMQECLLQIYLFKDDVNKANAIIEEFKQTIPKCIINNVGQCTETTRDLIHAQFQIGSILQFCEMSWHQGLKTLYAHSNNCISKCLEFHASILNGNIPLALKGQSLKDVWFMPSAWEIGYNHFVNRCKLQMPQTKLLLEKEKPKPNRPEGLSFNWGPGWLHFNSS